MIDRLREIANQYIEAGWQKGDVQALDRLLAKDFVNRGSNGGGATLAEFKQGISELFAGLPDFSAIVEDVVIDAAAGKAAIRWTGAGTHTGTMMGMPPTNKRMTFCGIDVIRVEGDRIAERWGESNCLPSRALKPRCLRIAERWGESNAAEVFSQT